MTICTCIVLIVNLLSEYIGVNGPVHEGKRRYKQVKYYYVANLLTEIILMKVYNVTG